TARRSADDATSDQVLAVFLKDDYSLEPVVGWDTLGMRGTRSDGFTLKARGDSDQILAEPYEKIHLRTMVPFAHMMWSATWAGVAAGAVERARMFVRNAARSAGGQLPPGATHLTRATASLQLLRGFIGSAVKRFEAASSDERELESIDFQTSMTLLKVNSSELAVSTVMSALQATGLSGYRNDNEFSMGRHLRDVLSSPIMINNDRILANLAAASLVSPVPALLMD
ncbi:MAG: acyl-CoA dehydrogenase family protein, partial [Xanthobacteraceae bacterium]